MEIFLGIMIFCGIVWTLAYYTTPPSVLEGTGINLVYNKNNYINNTMLKSENIYLKDSVHHYKMLYEFYYEQYRNLKDNATDRSPRIINSK